MVARKGAPVSDPTTGGDCGVITRLAQALAATAATSAVGVGSFVAVAADEPARPNRSSSPEAKVQTAATAWDRARIRREARAAAEVEHDEVGRAAIQGNAVGADEIAPGALGTDE